MKDYLRLLEFLKGHRKIFAIAVLTMVIASLFEGVQLSLLVPLTDRIFSNKPIVVPNQLPAFAANFINQLNSLDPQALLKVLPMWVLVLIITKHFFVFISKYLMNDISQLVMRDIRYKLYAKIQRLSLNYFSVKRTGELVSRITNDVLLIENAVSYGITDLFSQSFLILFYIIIACTIHFKAALIIFILFPLIGWPISRIGRKLKKISQNEQEKVADINSLLMETISGVKVVKAFCTENYEIGRFDKENKFFYRLRMKSIKRILFIVPITEIMGAICGILIILWVGKQVMVGEFSFGVFILFFGSIMSIISPMKKLGNVHAITQKALAANQRIYEVLDEEPTVKEKPNAFDLQTIKEKITFENVFFQYDAASGEVLKGINLEIKVGDLVAIVGPTGTGKSTLVNLIPRFYDINEGSIKIDGVDVRDVTFRSLRSQIGIVTQENILFNDTVRANVAYGYPQATQKEIEEACKKAFAHRFIKDLPKGYETITGDRGFRLSGGEKQRITIARAILRNPPLLILDEATSQLDSEAEKIVQEALDKLMQGRTVIAIAHRLSTVIKATKIVVLEKGQIIGLGNHEELLKICPLYKRLYETQFQV